MAGRTINSRRTPMIKRLVSVSERALPRRLGSSSRLSFACKAFDEDFYCSRILASSASLLDLIAYLYNLMIRMSLMSLRDFKIFVILPMFAVPLEEA
jgi:hypothetical protein